MHTRTHTHTFKSSTSLPAHTHTHTHTHPTHTHTHTHARTQTHTLDSTTGGGEFDDDRWAFQSTTIPQAAPPKRAIDLFKPPPAAHTAHTARTT